MTPTDNDRSKELARAIAREVWKPFWGTIATASLICFIFTSTDDTDRSWWHRSDMEIKTDCATGLQYLASGGGVTPRLNNNGTQMRKDCKP